MRIDNNNSKSFRLIECLNDKLESLQFNLKSSYATLLCSPPIDKKKLIFGIDLMNYKYFSIVLIVRNYGLR